MPIAPVGIIKHHKKHDADQAAAKAAAKDDDSIARFIWTPNVKIAEPLWKTLVQIAPELTDEKSIRNLDVDSIAALVGIVFEAFTTAQAQTLKDSVKVHGNLKHTANARAQHHLELAEKRSKEASDAAAEAHKADYATDTLAEVGAIALVILGVLTGNVIGIVTGIIGLVMASQQLVGDVLTDLKVTAPDEKDPVDISWGGVAKRIENLEVKTGAILRQDDSGNIIDAQGNRLDLNDDEKAKLKLAGVRIMTTADMTKEQQEIAEGLQIGIAVAMLAAGFAGMAGLGSAAEDTAQSVSTAVRNARAQAVAIATELFSDVGQGVSNAISAGYNDISTKAAYDESKQRNLAKLLQQWVKKYGKEMDLLEKQFKALIEKLNESTQSTFDTIEDVIRTHQKIARNTRFMA